MPLANIVQSNLNLAIIIVVLEAAFEKHFLRKVGNFVQSPMFRIFFVWLPVAFKCHKRWKLLRAIFLRIECLFLFLQLNMHQLHTLNSLAPGRFNFNFRQVIFKLTSVNGGWGISNEIAFRWMPLDLTEEMSTLVQVMAWCRQATGHYLGQCWPRFMSPYGVTMG